jgi:hypothetical protein
MLNKKVDEETPNKNVPDLNFPNGASPIKIQANDLIIQMPSEDFLGSTNLNYKKKFSKMIDTLSITKLQNTLDESTKESDFLNVKSLSVIDNQISITDFDSQDSFDRRVNDEENENQTNLDVLSEIDECKSSVSLFKYEKDTLDLPKMEQKLLKIDITQDDKDFPISTNKNKNESRRVLNRSRTFTIQSDVPLKKYILEKFSFD